MWVNDRADPQYRIAIDSHLQYALRTRPPPGGPAHEDFLRQAG